jgi:NADPH:quinone reductase-like Zn-dependent oxidoreductase
MATAITLTGVGLDALELREIPDAVAGSGEVAIAVEAASINPVDRGAVLRGYGEKMPGPAPWVLGWDLAGTVLAVGEGVEPDLVGRRVLGFSQWFKGGPGLQRSQVALPRDNIAVVDEAIAPPELTTFGLNGLTALQALDATGLETGQSVLVIGAGGGVGGFVAQLAEHRGLTVVRAGRDRTAQDLAGLELDGLVNTAPLDPTSYLSAVADGGVAISVTTPAETERGIRSSRVGVRVDRKGLETVAALADQGVLTTQVGLVLPAAQAIEAYRAEVAGRVVVTFP